MTYSEAIASLRAERESVSEQIEVLRAKRSSLTEQITALELAIRPPKASAAANPDDIVMSAEAAAMAMKYGK